MSLTVVSIGIQARSTSSRLPGKSSELLGRKTVVGHVIASAMRAATYINNYNSKKLLVDVNLLIPKGDKLKREWDGKINIIEGDEKDVLSRYVQLQRANNSDYLVRITGDCPLLPPFIISKLITLATQNQYDYVSNVEESVRTTADGHDLEVFSSRALDHVNQFASGVDREHVTSHIRKHMEFGWKKGCVINFLDLSHLKLSVDNADDLERVRTEWKKIDDAYTKAVKKFGRNSVHRL